MRVPSEEDQELLLAYLYTQDPVAVTSFEIARALDWGTERIFSVLMFVETRRLVHSEWEVPEPRPCGVPRKRVYWLDPILVPRVRSRIEEKIRLHGQPGVLN